MMSRIIFFLLLITIISCNKNNNTDTIKKNSDSICFRRDLDENYKKSIFYDEVGKRIIILNNYDSTIIKYSYLSNSIVSNKFGYSRYQNGINYELNELYWPKNNKIYIYDLNNLNIKDSIVLSENEIISSCVSKNNLLFVLSENLYYTFRIINRDTKVIEDSMSQGVYVTRNEVIDWNGAIKVFGFPEGNSDAFFNYIIDNNGKILENQTIWNHDPSLNINGENVAVSVNGNIVINGTNTINVFDNNLNLVKKLEGYMTYAISQDEKLIYASRMYKPYIDIFSYPKLECLDSIKTGSESLKIFLEKEFIITLELNQSNEVYFKKYNLVQ